MRPRRFRPDELPRDTVALARALIGTVLVRATAEGTTSGRIVEVEAYLPGDPASHAYRGMTRRNASMFLEPFRAYVYRIYGTAFCLNVTSEEVEVGAAVLIRAIEPLRGRMLMERRRGTADSRRLVSGPGRVCAALGIDLALDGAPLLSGRELWLACEQKPPGQVGASTRIGITKAAQERLRFYEVGSAFLSGPKRLSMP